MLSERARNGLCVLIAVVWAANFLASLMITSYEPDPSINGIFSGMIGAVLAAASSKKDKPDNGGNK